MTKQNKTSYAMGNITDKAPDIVDSVNNFQGKIRGFSKVNLTFLFNTFYIEFYLF